MPSPAPRRPPASRGVARATGSAANDGDGGKGDPAGASASERGGVWNGLAGARRFVDKMKLTRASADDADAASDAAERKARARAAAADGARATGAQSFGDPLGVANAWEGSEEDDDAADAASGASDDEKSSAEARVGSGANAGSTASDGDDDAIAAASWGEEDGARDDADEDDARGEENRRDTAARSRSGVWSALVNSAEVILLATAGGVKATQFLTQRAEMSRARRAHEKKLRAHDKAVKKAKEIAAQRGGVPAVPVPPPPPPTLPAATHVGWLADGALLGAMALGVIVRRAGGGAGGEENRAPPPLPTYGYAQVDADTPAGAAADASSAVGAVGAATSSNDDHLDDILKRVRARAATIADDVRVSKEEAEAAAARLDAAAAATAERRRLRAPSEPFDPFLPMPGAAEDGDAATMEDGEEKQAALGTSSMTSVEARAAEALAEMHRKSLEMAVAAERAATEARAEADEAKRGRLADVAEANARAEAAERAAVEARARAEEAEEQSRRMREKFSSDADRAMSSIRYLAAQSGAFAADAGPELRDGEWRSVNEVTYRSTSTGRSPPGVGGFPGSSRGGDAEEGSPPYELTAGDDSRTMDAWTSGGAEEDEETIALKREIEELKRKAAEARSRREGLARELE